MQDDTVSRKRARNVNHALVGTAAPVKLRIGLRLYKTTVDQHVNLIKKRQPLDFLPAVAGIQPDGLIRKLLLESRGTARSISSRLPGKSGSPPENVMPEI